MMAWAVTDLPEPDSPTIAVTAPAADAKADAFHDLDGRTVYVERHPEIADAKNLTLIQLVVPQTHNDAQLLSAATAGNRTGRRRLRQPLRML